MEEWRDIPGYENKYQVSDLGRVKSLDSIVNGGSGKRLWPGRMRKLTEGGNGYPVVSLNLEGKRMVFQVHTLVLITFVGPCPHGMEGCHEDGVRTNAKLSNLRWDTPKNNNADKVTHGTQTRGEKHGTSILKESQVVEIKKLLAAGFGQTELGRRFGVAPETIHSIKKGKSWRHV